MVNVEGELKGLPVSDELVAYYRNRVGSLIFLLKENSEKEYEEALLKVEGLQVSHEETHRLAWELHKRTREIAELQEGLSNAQTDLLQERQHLLRIMAENDHLKSIVLSLNIAP